LVSGRHSESAACCRPLLKQLMGFWACLGRWHDWTSFCHRHLGWVAEVSPRRHQQSSRHFPGHHQLFPCRYCVQKSLCALESWRWRPGAHFSTPATRCSVPASHSSVPVQSCSGRQGRSLLPAGRCLAYWHPEAWRSTAVRSWVVGCLSIFLVFLRCRIADAVVLACWLGHSQTLPAEPQASCRYLRAKTAGRWQASPRLGHLVSDRRGALRGTRPVPGELCHQSVANLAASAPCPEPEAGGLCFLASPTLRTPSRRPGSDSTRPCCCPGLGG
jgi:hypothetical protein